MRDDIPNDVESIQNNPIVILDIDGVLCAPEYIRTPKPSTIVALNRILQTTKAKIVISSSWKICEFMHDPILAELYLNSWGIIDPQVIGFTFGVSYSDEFRNGREREIDEWVKLFKPKNWCAIDDSVSECYRMVRTIHVEGLTENDADRVINWLMPIEVSNNWRNNYGYT